MSIVQLFSLSLQHEEDSDTNVDAGDYVPESLSG